MAETQQAGIDWQEMYRGAAEELRVCRAMLAQVIEQQGIGVVSLNEADVYEAIMRGDLELVAWKNRDRQTIELSVRRRI